MQSRNAIAELKQHLNQSIVGQESLVERLLIALLADGHLLVEGAPGLAKTRAIKALSEGIEADFQRVQFTPDLLPSDITGTEIYRPETGEFVFQKGPLFHHLILADEINRAPAKVQSALLEAMAEHQISVGGKTYALDKLFLVMATQNPIEQEGTYPLPEAQLDRFLMHIKVDYPDARMEAEILKIARGDAAGLSPSQIKPVALESIFSAREEILQLHMSEAVELYLIALVLATRNAENYDAELGEYIEFGASPRATIALDRCSRAHAWLMGRDFVTPDDVKAIAPDVLRHRLILSYTAQAKGMDNEQIIERLLQAVPVA